MSYTIKKENYPPFGEVPVGYIDVNGRQACIVYDPAAKPAGPFETEQLLEAYLLHVHAELEALPPYEENTTTIETAISVKKWRPDLFWREFTQEERLKFLELTKIDPVLEDFKMQLTMAPVILSNDEQFLRGMIYIVSKNIITEERKQAIIGDI